MGAGLMSIREIVANPGFIGPDTLLLNLGTPAAIVGA